MWTLMRKSRQDFIAHQWTLIFNTMETRDVSFEYLHLVILFLLKFRWKSWLGKTDRETCDDTRQDQNIINKWRSRQSCAETSTSFDELNKVLKKVDNLVYAVKLYHLVCHSDHARVSLIVMRMRRTYPTYLHFTTISKPWRLDQDAFVYKNYLNFWSAR